MTVAHLATVDGLSNAIGLPHGYALLSLPLLHSVLQEWDGLVLIANDDREVHSVTLSELELGLVLDVDFEVILDLEHLVVDRLREHRCHHLKIAVHTGSRSDVLVLHRDLQLHGFDLVGVCGDARVLEGNDDLLVIDDWLGDDTRALLLAAKELNFSDQLRLEALHILLTVGVVYIDADLNSLARLKDRFLNRNHRTHLSGSNTGDSTDL